jgi:uncharacterized protein YqiB (DUF1249 family)
LVTYLPSQRTVSVTVQQQQVEQYSTTITIDQYSATIYLNQPFTVSGQLIANTPLGPSPLPNMPVQLYFDDQYLGQVNTDSTGRYTFRVTVAVASPGTHNITVKFPGATV